MILYNIYRILKEKNPRSSFDLKHHVLDNFENSLNINTDYIRTFWIDDNE